MPLYFAYGSNMDSAAMAARCPRTRLIGRGRLPRWRPALMGSGYLTVEPSPGSSVHGLLWDVPASDVTALDRYEEVAQRLYVKRVMPVLRAPAGSAQALVYVGANPGRSSASADYLAGVVAAAQAHGLPTEYIAYLGALGGLSPGPAPPRFRAIKLGVKDPQ